MPTPPKVDGVQSALNDLLKLEQERLQKEEAVRKAMEEDERRKSEEDRRRREEEAVRKRREEEDLILAREKSLRDEEDRRKRDRELEEIKLKRELEMKQRMDEERLRMDHEKQLKVIEAQHKKGFPMWVAGVIAGIVIIGGSVGGILGYKMQQDKKNLEKEKLAAIQALEEKERNTATQITDLTKLVEQFQSNANKSEQELARQKEIQAKIDELRQQQEDSRAKIKRIKKIKKGDGKEEGGLNLNDPLSFMP